MSNSGNSNTISREYLDSLLIETRYLNSAVPDTTFQLYGETFSTPIMTAALSHLDHFMSPGAGEAFAKGAAAAGAVFWIGMTEDDKEMERYASSGARVVEIIKPYKDRERIAEKIRRAERLGHLAVGVDIDHPFGEDGSPDVVDGLEMAALTTKELIDLVQSTKLPVILKGVLSVADAQIALSCGCRGILLSHHNNRIEYAVPPLYLLPEITKVVAGRMKVFVDCEIRTGMDAFKALSLGADAVGIGRPLMTAIKENGADGVRDYLRKATDGLRKAMAYTGCTDLTKMDPSVIHRRNF
ncbi:MAG TPA: alpha-hydroxy-acid oxidizing enzyme [Lachnospiraceae bacterium]|nr:alpha-hydroxy-acid oxidizing enzyme [Lachnospiraceae bacterium]